MDLSLLGGVPRRALWEVGGHALPARGPALPDLEEDPDEALELSGSTIEPSKFRRALPRQPYGVAQQGAASAATLPHPHCTGGANAVPCVPSVLSANVSTGVGEPCGMSAERWSTEPRSRSDVL